MARDIRYFKSTKYFQLIPDILVEYNYYNLVSVGDQTGDVSDHILDFGPDDHNGLIISNAICATNTFVYDDTEDNLVLPINRSESKFVQCVSDNSKIWNWNRTDFGCTQFSESSGIDDLKDDIFCDTFRLHFTSRNYLGNNNYDGFIITIYLYDKYKNKIGLLSQYVRKTDDPHINQDPVLINQKLYTTYMDFKVPNTAAMVESKSNYISQVLPGEEELRKKLFTKYDILDNSPMVMNIYGVKSTYEDNGHEFYTTEKLNSIYIPIVDKSNNLSVVVNEAEDGDYFEIYPSVDNEVISFSDYIYNLSDGRPELYIVFHEITLTEIYVDAMNEIQKDITHREQFIINAAQQIDDNDDTVLEINEKELDRKLFYRPVIHHGGKIISFIIDVKTNIINTLDNTTIVKQSSLQYGGEEPDGELKFIPGSPKKYGKRMSKIYLGDIPAQVNVYNKKPDIDIDGVKITNASSNVKIENHQHSIMGFIECANVGVSVEQVPKERLQE